MAILRGKAISTQSLNNDQVSPLIKLDIYSSISGKSTYLLLAPDSLPHRT